MVPCQKFEATHARCAAMDALGRDGTLRVTEKKAASIAAAEAIAECFGSAAPLTMKLDPAGRRERWQFRRTAVPQFYEENRKR